MTTGDKNRLTKGCIPGKVSYAAMYFLLAWSSSGNDQETEESKPQKEMQVMFGNPEDPLDKECEIQIGDALLVVKGEPSDKAVKSDDAAVPVHLWNEQVATQLMEL